ncbi:phage tail tape measure protein [Paraclostridium bifermentans]|uniref:phage tail tape measure protein n=1 Tax=Paraclostridium bifermentans TaxID=1490 RepID=UPI001FF4E080|nr:phage tail tape measure protein [Paraclostridium bifermentans]UOW66856.1 phage tail tape measure protein [Paraclostridium bifermentans]
MSMNLGTATAYIDLDASKFKNGMISVANGLNDFNNRSLSASDRFNALGNSMKTVGGGLTRYVSVPLAGVGLASVNAAMKTETSFAKVNSILKLNKTSVGGAKSEWDKFSQTLKNGANDIGLSYDAYADAAYQAISAGVEQANVTKFLNDANKLAKGGLTDLTTATDLLTSVQNAYGLSQKDMIKVSDTLIQTQNFGKTTVDELAQSMGKVIPTAKNLGVNVDQLGAAYAIMTSKGIGTAESTTYLNSMFNELGKSGTKVDKALKEVSGKSFKELTESGMSTGDVLGILAKHAEDSGLSLSDLFGSAEAGKAALNLMSEGADGFNEMLKNMTESSGSTNKAFNEMNDTAKEKLTQSLSKLKNALADLGIALIPLVEIVANMISKFSEWVTSIAETNPQLLETAVKIGALVAVAGPLILLVGSLITAFTTIGSTLSTVAGIFGITSGAAGILGGILSGGLIFALFGLIAKLGESREALGWLQDKFGSLGTVIGGVCEFIAGIWNLTIDNMINVGKLGFDVLAALIDGPGGATVKDAFAKYSKGVEETNKKAWDNITMKTTRELSQQKNSVDKETKEASDKAKTNTDKMAKDMTDNAKKGADGVGKEMKNTSKVVMDESGKIPKDVQSNMQKSVQAMRQAGSDIYNGMNTSFSKLASQGKQHFSDLYNGVTRSTSKMASQVISDWNRIRSALSGTITGNIQIKVHGVQAALNQINSVKNAAKTRSISPSPFMNLMAMPQSFAMPIDTNMYAQAYDMVKSNDIASYVSSQIPSAINLNIDSDNGKNPNESTDRNINVEVKIDKFENKTSDSPKEIAEQVVDQVIYKIKRERYALGGA